MSRPQYSTNAIKNDEPDVQNCERENNKLKTVAENLYRNKSALAQGMLDIALLTANASQLRYLLIVGNERYEDYEWTMTLIISSIILQLIVGVSFIAVQNLDMSRKVEQKISNVLNDMAFVLVFLIIVINVIISSIGIKYASKPLDLL